MVDLVIFDLDDTLVRTADMERHARESALRALKVPLDVSVGIATWRRLTWYFGGDDIALLLQVLHSNLVDRLGVSAATINSAVEAYDERFWDNLRPMDGAARTLEALYESGVKVAIATNGTLDHQLRKLQVAGLSQYFHPSLVLVAEVGSSLSKPRPDGLLWLVNAAHVQVESAIYVGDRLADMVAAHLAGLRACVHIDGESIEAHEPPSPECDLERADFYIRHLDELTEILAQLDTPAGSAIKGGLP